MLYRTLLAVTLVLSPAALGQISEKDAVERLEDAIDEAEDAFKDALKDASKRGVSTIKAFGKSVKDEGFDELVAQTMFFEMADVHGDIQVAYDAALMSIAQAGADALADLANDPDDVQSLDGRYPKAFYERQGGFVGKAKADLAKRTEKIARKFASTFKKTAKLVEKEAGYSFHYVVKPVQPVFDVTFREEGVVVDNGSSTGGVSIDLIVGWSDLDVVFDARMFASGGAGDAVSTGYGYHVDPFIASSSTSLVPADNRWQIGAGGGEGNFVLSVFVDENSDFEGDGISQAFGVR